MNYIFGDLHKICKQTNNDCNWGSCLYFHNNLIGSSLDCTLVDTEFRGLTIRHIILLSLFFRFYKYENLLNMKYQLIDIINVMYSKEAKTINLKNNFSTPLLSTLFDKKHNVKVDDKYRMDKLIKDIVITKDVTKKMKNFLIVKTYIEDIYYKHGNSFYNLFNFINLSFEDFFKDYHITNNILVEDNDKTKFINTLLNIYKILLHFPNHVGDINITTDGINRLKTKINSLKLSNKKINYLDGDLDDERLSDFTNQDEVMVYIASIDSYYFIYKKYEINDRELFLLFEVYDYLTELNQTDSQLDKFFIEVSNIIKYVISNNFTIDVDDMF